MLARGRSGGGGGGRGVGSHFGDAERTGAAREHEAHKAASANTRESEGAQSGGCHRCKASSQHQRAVGSKGTQVELEATEVGLICWRDCVEDAEGLDLHFFKESELQPRAVAGDAACGHLTAVGAPIRRLRRVDSGRGDALEAQSREIGR